MNGAVPLRILGIDPGLRITGFGVIEKSGARLSYVTSGCIKSPGRELPERLKSILESLREVIAAHHPHQVVVEKVFVNGVCRPSKITVFHIMALADKIKHNPNKIDNRCPFPNLILIPIVAPLDYQNKHKIYLNVSYSFNQKYHQKAHQEYHQQ